MLSFDVLLVIGLLGFYLVDSALLLFANELVFTQSKGQWSFALPSGHWQFRKKLLYLPNPLTPDMPLFRVHWSAQTTDAQADTEDSIRAFLHALTPLRYLSAILLGLFVVLIPSVYFKLGTEFSLLLLMASIYVCILSMLIITYRRRNVFGLTTKQFVKLAFDALVCAPFALNTVRKICLQRAIAGDPIAFAQQSFSPDTFAVFLRALGQRVEDQLEIVDQASPRYEALQNLRNRIAGLTI